MTDLYYDVICLGSGAAGLTGALRSADRGAHTLVLEKAAAFGGTTAWSYGGLWAGANHVQRTLGIADTLADASKYVRFLAGGFADRDRLDRFVEMAPKVFEYVDGLGVSLREIAGVPDLYYPDAPGSSNRGRCLEAVPIERRELGDYESLIEPSEAFPPGVSWSEMVAWGGPANRHRWNTKLLAERASSFAAGQALIARLLKACLERGVELLSSSPATSLITEDGRVTGVRATVNGEPRDIRARRGVLIATGSYLANRSLVRALEDFADAGNHMQMSATGDGLVMAAEIGALVSKIPLHLARSLGYMVPANDRGVAPHFESAGVTQLPYPHCIVVNRRGNRFGDESFFQKLVPRLHEFDMTIHALANLPCFMIFDDEFARRYGFAGSSPGDVPSWVPRTATLQGLAEQLGIESEAFEQTINRFNDGAHRGIDADFGRGQSAWARGSTGDAAAGAVVNANLGALDTPPYYGVELVPQGAGAAGLTADIDGRVLHLRGHAIAGLYGAGIVCVVNEYGAGYQAGFSLASGMVFAYLAIEDALR